MQRELELHSSEQAPPKIDLVPDREDDNTLYEKLEEGVFAIEEALYPDINNMQRPEKDLAYEKKSQKYMDKGPTPVINRETIKDPQIDFASLKAHEKQRDLKESQLEQMKERVRKSQFWKKLINYTHEKPTMRTLTPDEEDLQNDIQFWKTLD
ncbi:hypothetical protein FGO68_gene2544 [Halteria grandinella]|uniref:Uncharacterized protein n=1 Tax=Halteria grandinella TaxID=5974 RepID=A0A8J8SYQ5_HALGN|nr:hypothetical protein FGO68_gene2544 [Halteria grandinella]